MKKIFGKKSKKDSDRKSNASKSSKKSAKSIISNLFKGSDSSSHKIHKYAQNGDKKKFQIAYDQLISPDPSAINTVNDQRQTPLHLACSEGHTDIAKLILSSPAAKVNLFDSQQKTPLMYATENQWHSIIDELLKRKADTDLKDRKGNTALHYACKVPSTGLVKALVQKGGANVNIKNGDGQTPLQIAVPSSNTVLINSLLQFQADINTKDLQGRTPLMIASQIGLYNVVNHLLIKGADKKIRDTKGNLAMDYALNAKNNSIAELVKPAGVGVLNKAVKDQIPDKDQQQANLFAVASAKKFEPAYQPGQARQSVLNANNNRTIDTNEIDMNNESWESSSSSSSSTRQNPAPAFISQSTISQNKTIDPPRFANTYLEESTLAETTIHGDKAKAYDSSIMDTTVGATPGQANAYETSFADTTIGAPKNAAAYHSANTSIANTTRNANTYLESSVVSSNYPGNQQLDVNLDSILDTNSEVSETTTKANQKANFFAKESTINSGSSTSSASVSLIDAEPSIKTTTPKNETRLVNDLQHLGSFKSQKSEVSLSLTSESSTSSQEVKKNPVTMTRQTSYANFFQKSHHKNTFCF